MDIPYNSLHGTAPFGMTNVYFKCCGSRPSFGSRGQCRCRDRLRNANTRPGAACKTQIVVTTTGVWSAMIVGDDSFRRGWRGDGEGQRDPTFPPDHRGRATGTAPAGRVFDGLPVVGSPLRAIIVVKCADGVLGADDTRSAACERDRR